MNSIELDEELTPVKLLSQSFASTSSRISPSVYESGRVAAIAPWLEGHRERVLYLLRQQATDGGWGMATARLVPTLSATEALLTIGKDAVGVELWNATQAAVPSALRFLHQEISKSRTMDNLPDTVAIEFIVPALTLRINSILEKDDDGVERLPLLAGAQVEHLAKLRHGVLTGHIPSRKLWHSWETFGSAEAASLVHTDGGAVACSPAATALWAGAQPEVPADTRHYFAELNARDGGPVPVAAPMPHFERSWLLTTFAVYGVPYTAPGTWLDILDATLSSRGAAAGDGLPPDADDTAMVSSALAMSGRCVDLEPMMSFFRGSHFQCYPRERTSSPSTNAHALTALSAVAQRCGLDSKTAAAARSTARWLVASQCPDGSWVDKWHLSPFYSTWCCVQSLAAATTFDLIPDREEVWAAENAVTAAVDWMLSTRSAAGWGSVGENLEETCYAALVLSRATRPDQVRAARPAMRAALAILEDSHPEESWPTLWIGKDLYAPQRVIQGIRLTARQVLHTLLGPANVA